MSTGYVSVLSTNYFLPITTLLEKLEVLELHPPNEVKASDPDNGYSVSLIVLSVLLIESAIGRTQYVMGEQPVKGKLRAPVNVVRSEFPDSGFCEKIEELFVVRDVIVHNHIWEASFEWDDQVGMKFVSSPTKRDGYGDPKFDRVVDFAERKTRLLRINLFPTRIHRSDAIIVLQNTVEFLKFLENKNNNYIYMSHLNVKFNGKLERFVELIANLKP